VPAKIGDDVLTTLAVPKEAIVCIRRESESGSPGEPEPDTPEFEPAMDPPDAVGDWQDNEGSILRAKRS
jgi:hypothetical protein